MIDVFDASAGQIARNRSAGLDRHEQRFASVRPPPRLPRQRASRRTRQPAEKCASGNASGHRGNLARKTNGRSDGDGRGMTMAAEEAASQKDASRPSGHFNPADGPSPSGGNAMGEVARNVIDCRQAGARCKGRFSRTSAKKRPPVRSCPRGAEDNILIRERLDACRTGFGDASAAAFKCLEACS